MSMTSPESYLNDLKDKPYAELITERNKIIEDMRNLEQELLNPAPKQFIINPGPDVQYWWTLETLSMLLKLMADRHGELTDENSQ